MTERAPHQSDSGTHRAVSPEEAYLKGPFLGRVAHELRGPSGVISGAMQELESSLGADAEKHRALLAMMQRGINRVLRIAARLEDTGLLENHHVTYAMANIDVRKVVQDAAAEAEALEARRRVKVTVEVPDEAAHAKADPRWLGTAVSEIVSNAIRHARENVKVSVVVDTKGLHIICTDDQTGGTDFAPVRFTEPAERRGLGLGLAIVQDVAEAHGAELTIEPGKTTGARVTISFPRTDDAKGRSA